MGHGINFLSLLEPLPRLTATTNLHTRTSMLVEASALLQSLNQETIATTALLCHLKRHCIAQDPSSGSIGTPDIAAAIGLLLTGMQKNPFFAPPLSPSPRLPVFLTSLLFPDRGLRAHRQMDLPFDTYSPS